MVTLNALRASHEHDQLAAFCPHSTLNQPCPIRSEFTSGNKLRITAQLIRTADSTHLWSETYDRTLEDVFALQDDIATQVVKALQVKLLGDEALKPATPRDTEAYSLFLQGRFFAQRRTVEA